MNVIQVKCPHCSTPIYSKVKDTVFFCQNCRTIHIRNGGVRILDYEIADFAKNAPMERVYVPFWRLYSSFSINNSNVAGGSFHKLGNWLKGGSNQGSIFIYIPASEMDIYQFKHYSVGITQSQPGYSLRTDFGPVDRIPAIMTREEAVKMADFVIVTMEAEKPGTLQYLDYNLQVHDAKLLYLPFVRTANGIAPAF